MTELPTDLLQRLKQHKQEDVLAGWDALSPDDRSRLVGQLSRIDFAQLETLYRKKDEPAAVLPPREKIAPMPVEPAGGDLTSARRAGELALARGEVAALVVAGGQGSRLGFDKPKGMYKVGPVSGATLFRVHAEKVLALSRRYGKPVPFLVMTSPATDADTRDDFAANDYFGLPKEQVHFFEQGTMPSLDLETGRLLLERPGSVFLSPNGHGGTLTALADTGLLANLKARGVKHVFYFQVDNPLVKVCDPAFVGRHIETESEASSRVVFKTQPGEKVGVLALVDGRCSIVEYSDMPADMQAEKAADGTLRFRAGNPAIHLFSVSFLERVTSEGGGLPYHLARKKVACLGPDGTPLTPTKENALKFEQFVFDALPKADRWLAMEAKREEEFAPLKNATGADSPDTVRDLLVGEAARWLTAAGVSVPTDAAGKSMYPLEVSPLFALDADELKRKLPAGFAVSGPTVLK